MKAGQCDNQMGTKFLDVLRDEHGIGGGAAGYCGDNDAHFDRINEYTTRPRTSSTYHAPSSSTSNPA
jgi:hypothetical protein